MSKKVLPSKKSAPVKKSFLEDEMERMLFHLWYHGFGHWEKCVWETKKGKEDYLIAQFGTNDNIAYRICLYEDVDGDSSEGFALLELILEDGQEDKILAQNLSVDGMMEQIFKLLVEDKLFCS